MLQPAGEYYVTTVDLELSGLLIPRGTRTNGASIPSILWGTIKSPFDPQIILPALYHDYAYRTGCDRKKADTKFKELLLQYGISPLKSKLIYTAVRLFGAPYFRKCQRCY